MTWDKYTTEKKRLVYAQSNKYMEMTKNAQLIKSYRRQKKTKSNF